MTILSRLIAPDRRLKRESVAADFSLGMMLSDCAAAVHSLSRAAALLVPALDAGAKCTPQLVATCAEKAHASAAYAIQSLVRAFSHYRELGAAFDKTTSLGFLTRMVNRRHCDPNARQNLPHLAPAVLDDCAYGVREAYDAARTAADGAHDLARTLFENKTEVRQFETAILSALGLAAFTNEALNDARKSD